MRRGCLQHVTVGDGLHLVDLPVALTNIVVAVLSVWLLGLSFGSVAFALSATGRARVASVGVGTAVALGSYIINSLTGTVTWLQAPDRILPFHYYRSQEILSGVHVWRNLLFFIVFAMVFGLLSWIAFRRRDLA